MRILIAPDKFKGSLSAREVAENMAKGFSEVLRDATIDILPMADGGEGTAEVICDALGGSWVRCKAHDPLGREIEARYVWIENHPPSPRLRRDTGKLAVMEMSEAAGMRRLQPNELDPDRASTFGVGEMILDATRRSAERIIIGLGGSATNDGGFGMARALGFEFDHEHEREREKEGWVSHLPLLKEIHRPGQLVLPQIIAAADVRNPLLGSDGATRVFGPQKGVAQDRIEVFERGLKQLAEVVSKDLGVDYRSGPGAGAAGGLGFGLMSFCGAEVRAGFDVVTEFVGLEAKMKDVDLVITGEGKLDRQTLGGKTPAGVAALARKLGKRVYAVVGCADENEEVRGLFDAVFVLGGSIPEAKQLVQKRAGELAETLRRA